MTQTYPVTGVEHAGVQLRLELRDLEKDAVQFSLFIRALTKIHDMRNTVDEHSTDYFNKPNSWWQMGAIHGLPFIAWSGDPEGKKKPDPKSNYGGYCYHGSTLFPTWHRVVMLLVEQAVVNEAIAIASELGNEQWVEAAKKLRFPFWDWTNLKTAEEGIPLIFRQTKVTIINPDGSPVEVHNPLNHYRYASEPGNAAGFEYMGKWKRTYRWINNIDNPSVEMYDMAQKQKVAGLFDYPLTLEDPSYGPNLWGHFSTTGAGNVYVPGGISEALANIEESHNKVHLDIGGVGSMSVNEYAAFDPIFYLHHCNVDRIYAFWEYVYPEYWMENGWKDKDGNTKLFTVDEDGTFYQPPYAPICHSSSLPPFRTNAQHLPYWTSDDTRSLLATSSTKKYYTYPPIKDLTTGVEVNVNVPYDPKNLELRMKYQQTLKDHWGTVTTLVTLQELSLPDPRAIPLLRLLFSEKHLRHFIVIGHVPEFAFPGSYILELYLRKEVTQHATDQVINSVSVLGRGNHEKCAACRDRQAAGSQIRGYMYLDPVIILYLMGIYWSTIGDPQPRWRNLPAAAAGLQGDQLFDLPWLTRLINASLGWRLVRPDRTPLAAPDATLPLNHHEGLDATKIPKLALHSRLVAVESKFSTYGSVSEVENHGQLEEDGGWKVY